MNRHSLLGLSMVAATMLWPAVTLAQSTATGAKPAAKSATTAKKPVSQSRKELHSEALGLAMATEVTETISEDQLTISNRVLTGQAQCEFNQTVSVIAVQDKPGHFHVTFNKSVYTMTPQETSTGAVRLEDRRNGVVWLQIPSKSMMMNQKIGRRMVDGCTQAEQRAAVSAVQAAAGAK